MNTVLRWIGQVFSTNLVLSTLKNDVAHTLIAFETAGAKIKEAEEWAKQVKATESAKFAALKSTTITRTRKAVANLKEAAMEEAADLEAYYQDARALVDTKFKSADSLEQKISSLDLENHSL